MAGGTVAGRSLPGAVVRGARAFGSGGPLRRARAVFLAIAVFNVVLSAPVLAAPGVSSLPQRLAAAAVALAAWLVRGFHRGGMPVWSDAAEACLLLAFGVGLPRPARLLGPLFGALLFRGLLGSGRAALARAGWYALVMEAVVWVHPQPDQMLRPGPLAAWMAPGFLLQTVAALALALARAGHERGLERERRVARCGAALLTARTEAAIRAVVVEATRAILDAAAGRGPARAALAVRAGEEGLRPAVGGADQDAALLDNRAGPRADTVAVPLRGSCGAEPGLLVGRAGRPLGEDARRAVGAVATNVAFALENVALAERLSRRASHDTLTALPNRAMFADALAHPAGGRVAVLFVDLDDFKTVNDALGHAAGDALLAAVAARLLRARRDGDVVARLGGDEFAVLIRGATDRIAAVRVAERIIEALDEQFTVDGQQMFVHASIGVALDGAGETAGEMLRNADTAMYVAKAAGKARVEVFTPAMHEAVTSELALREDLARALDAGELVLHYQPVAAVADGSLRGFEALLRWAHPQRGLLPPMDFIPLAEQTGLIVPIERWVLDQACRQAATWPATAGGDRPFVSVNLSARHLAEPAVTDAVRQALRASGLDPARLHIEVTETAQVDDRHDAVARLRRIRDLGARVALDDFGTGYSSLAALAHLPIDTVEIDKDFLDQPHNITLLPAITAIAESLGLRIVVEGVETTAQWEAVRDAGCALAQGYLLSRPVPADRLPALIRAAAPVTGGADTALTA